MDTPDELKRCVQTLAQPGQVQISLFPAFACAGDEMAIEFDAALTAFKAMPSDANPAQLQALEHLDALLERMSRPGNEEFWLDRDDLLQHPHWSEVRHRARAVLEAFGWPFVLPPGSGAVYVGGAGRPRDDA